MPLDCRRSSLPLVVATIAAALLPGAAHAAKATACTKIALCYCVEDAVKPTVEARIATIRGMLAAERGKGKSIGYMSLPLSSAGGAVYAINAEVAASVKKQVEKRMGENQVFLLNPAIPETDIPNGGGADYMLMWTSVMEGRDGLGEDFDFVYFVGPQDFARYFGLDGTGDMAKLEKYFDDRLKTDPEMKKAVDKGLTRTQFRNYYALKASSTFSRGAHDEWNIVRTLNERRRADAKFGIPNQIPTLFDGGGTSPAGSEGGTSEGYVAKCSP